MYFGQSVILSGNLYKMKSDLEMNVTVMTLITIVTVETVVTPTLLYTFSFLPSIINQKPEALSKLVACFT